MAKQFFPWFLVLMMIISPIQVSMAVNIDQHSHVPDCQITMDTGISIGDSMNCAMEHDEHCQEHAGCVGQFNSSSFQASNSFLIAPRTSQQVKFITENDEIPSVYPSQLKRPPKT